MKFLLLPVLMAFFTVAQVFCEENDPKDETDYWTGSNQIQDGWLNNDPFREILLRMTRKPRPHQFIGLMGKRSMAANAQITRKTGPKNPGISLQKYSYHSNHNVSDPSYCYVSGLKYTCQLTAQHTTDCPIKYISRVCEGHKVNSFVGLMGKRSQEEPESYEWSTIQTYDKRR